MDVDLMIKSATEDQVEMMMMMMMMHKDKLPVEFCGPYPGVVTELPSLMEFSCATTGNGTTTTIGGPSPILFDNPHVPSSSYSSPTLIPNTPSTITFMGTAPQPIFRNGWLRNATGELSGAQKKNSMAAMREMIFRIAAMQPIHIDPESVKPPKRRNVKISKDPQSVAARHRRERISERIRILQRLVPGGTKMDTASMLDEAIHYVKFLQTQVQSLEAAAANKPAAFGFPATAPPPSSSSSPFIPPTQMLS